MTICRTGAFFLGLFLSAGVALGGEPAEEAAAATDGYITLEDLDQSTVHNVLRMAERPEAADLVWEMIEKGNIGTAPEEMPVTIPQIPQVPLSPSTPPEGNVQLMRGPGPQMPPR